jgi:hypothetical protein
VSRQDFEMIAATIREHRADFGDAAADSLAEAFAWKLANRHSVFNYARFIAATK